MLIDATSDPERLNEVGLRWWSNERFTIGWKGHLFLPGYPGGAPSVAELATMLTTSTLADIAQEICGVFGIFVHDRAEGGWRICVDSSGLYKVFYDARSASTSFLEIVRARRTGRNDLADEALIEFIAYGAVFSGRTFVTTIAELRGGEVLQILADGSQTRTERKTLSTQDVAPADTAVVDYCRNLARSLDGRVLSVDATGGFDSRLVLCLLGNQGLPFELAISGLPGTEDTEIARRIATMLDRPFHLAGHDLDNFDQVLSATFRDGDGQTDVRRLHRDRQAALARLGRGVEVMAHGGGGEYFRDHYVIQDFPFYGSSRVNFKRYHDLRMMPVELPLEALSSRGRDLFVALRPAMLARFQELLASTNNEILMTKSICIYVDLSSMANIFQTISMWDWT